MALCLAPADRRSSPAPHGDTAWHLLATLLRLGRPAHPTELAEECSGALKFPVSADLVEFLCRLDGSPLSRNRDGLVTLSVCALVAVAGFVQNKGMAILPPVGDGGLRTVRICAGTGPTGCFSRKRSGLSLLPLAKRRTLRLPPNCDDSESASDVTFPAWLKETLRNHATKGVVINIDIAESVSRNHFNLSVLHHNGIVDNSKENGSRGFLRRDNNPFILEDKLDDLENDNAAGTGSQNASQVEPIVHRNMQDYNFSLSKHDNSLGADESERIIHEGAALKQPPVCQMDGELANLATVSREPKRLDEDGHNKFFPITYNPVRRRSVNLKQETCTEDQEAAGTVRPQESTCHSTENLVLDDSGPCLISQNVTVKDKYDDGSVNLQPCDGKNGEGPTISVCFQSTLNTLFPDAGCNDRLCSSATHDNNDGAVSKFDKETLVQEEAAYVPDSAGAKDSGSLSDNQDRSVKNQDQLVVNKKSDVKKFKVKQRNPTKENAVEADTKIDKVPEPKKLPKFDSFVVEEEEGSGGYGTVYRAKRKKDGKVFAIKCPHVKARSFHVNNELKMLERFGGRNFVIKFEGSFKSGNSECFVLEHVQHDRPELLKKDIDLLELQWYGYCMFKALASLHKQGVIHRDVKPGNFLFSRVYNKGYLIDFNLAMDLHHKPRTSSAADLHSKEGLTKSPSRKPELSILSRRLLTTGFKEPLGRGGHNGPNKVLNKHVKKPVIKDGFGVYPDKVDRRKQMSKGADGSGLSSVRDATSNKTPSVERSKEPVPCTGRKELLNLVQEVLRSPNQKALPPPVSLRKRVAAPLGRVDRILASLTPMPLHSNGIPVSFGEQLKNKGLKHKSEGPCVGTKGFRAPEVLFRSPHQSCKVDMWSAGVTILYMIAGRTPFSGEPEQNIKEIARLRGSEDLWEVAKLHNRESSFPSELFDIQFLPSLELRQWCEKNTKRPDFLKKIPSSLFNLVDKCLTVNPRLRISAEEALMHDFFLPCRESLRRQRSLRQSRDSEMGSQL